MFSDSSRKWIGPVVPAQPAFAPERRRTLTDPSRVAEEDLVGVGEEEAMVDHAQCRLQGGGDRLEVAGREGAVEGVAALVGDERGPVGGVTEGGLWHQVEEAAAGGGFSHHARGGGIWPDGAGMPDPQPQAPPTNPAPEPATAGN
jgi:hypothetical protein